MPGKALGLALALAVTLGGAAGCGGRARTGDPKQLRVAPTATLVSVGGAPLGRPIAAGFVGLSIEYYAVRAYTGRDPRAIDPVLLALIRNLAPAQTPVLRIGGDSTDTTWWPIPGMARPAGIANTLSPAWLAAVKALAANLGARLILGINLKADSTKLAAAEVRALARGIGRRYIEAFEIGNEPEEYGRLPWYLDPDGRAVYARPPSYGLPQYIAQFERMREALPTVPLAGPAIGLRDQLSYVVKLLRADPDLGLATLHRYPLDSCFVSLSSPQYPTLAHLLSPSASHGLMSGVARWVSYARARGVLFRVDELGSVACGGAHGLSDTFASALWVLDTLFEAARAGVDGVNLHMFPGAQYAPFAVEHLSGRWHAVVHPEYYGALLFSDAAPAGSRLLPVRVHGPTSIRAWATAGPGPDLHVVLINDATTRARLVLIRMPVAAGVATLARLLAPGVLSTGGVTLAGQTFGPATGSGRLTGRRSSTTIAPQQGTYAVRVPAASAALLTFSRAPAPGG